MHPLSPDGVDTEEIPMLSERTIWVLAIVCIIVLSALMARRASAETPSRRPLITIDNEDETFSTVGEGWNPSTRDPGFYGNGYLWHARGDGEAKAIWRADLATPGRYNVYARWVMSKPADRARNAPFTVKTAEGEATVRVDMAQRQSAAEFPAGRVQSAWNLLGTFPLEKEAEIVLSNDADNSVVADAIRIEYMEPLDAPIPTRGQVLFRDDFETIENWFIEGDEGRAEIADGSLRVVSTSHKKGIHAWFRPDLPGDVWIEYDMTVHSPKGFALVFFSTHTSKNQDILTDLPPRDGSFGQYVNNPQILGYHLSVHRYGTESWVQGANLNKNPGKTLIQRNAVDPCPPSEDDRTHHLTLVKTGRRIQFFADDRPVLFYIDDDPKPYDGGKFGFRQIYLSTISYDSLRIYQAAMPQTDREIGR